MGTLTMALAAALLAGSGSGKVSGEVEQRLDLTGRWVGSWRHSTGTLMVASLAANRHPSEKYRMIEGTSENGGGVAIPAIRIVDEGKGRFCLTEGGLGIYAVRGEQVILCYRHASRGYPSAFYGGNGQNLIILHRIKTRK